MFNQLNYKRNQPQGGVLDPCLGIGVPLRIGNPDPVYDKNALKTLPCVGQQLPFHDPV